MFFFLLDYLVVLAFLLFHRTNVFDSLVASRVQSF